MCVIQKKKRCPCNSDCFSALIPIHHHKYLKLLCLHEYQPKSEFSWLPLFCKLFSIIMGAEEGKPGHTCEDSEHNYMELKPFHLYLSTFRSLSRLTPSLAPLVLNIVN